MENKQDLINKLNEFDYNIEWNDALDIARNVLKLDQLSKEKVLKLYNNFINENNFADKNHIEPEAQVKPKVKEYNPFEPEVNINKLNNENLNQDSDNEVTKQVLLPEYEDNITIEEVGEKTKQHEIEIENQEDFDSLFESQFEALKRNNSEKKKDSVKKDVKLDNVKKVVQSKEIKKTVQSDNIQDDDSDENTKISSMESVENGWDGSLSVPAVNVLKPRENKKMVNDDKTSILKYEKVRSNIIDKKDEIQSEDLNLHEESIKLEESMDEDISLDFIKSVSDLLPSDIFDNSKNKGKIVESDDDYEGSTVIDSKSVQLDESDGDDKTKANYNSDKTVANYNEDRTQYEIDIKTNVTKKKR